MERRYFIGEKIGLDPVSLNHRHHADELLLFYMGTNTPERQDFAIGGGEGENDPVWREFYLCEILCVMEMLWMLIEADQQGGIRL